MKDFEIITAKERDRLMSGSGGRGAARSARTQRLLEGSILFVTGKDPDALRRTLISLAKHHGKRARTHKTTRDGTEGIVVWWEDREAGPDPLRRPRGR